MKRTAKFFTAVMFALVLMCVTFVSANAAVTSSVGTVSKIKVTATSDTLTLSWRKAENAKGYRVYELVSDKLVTMVTTKASACILTDLSAGSEHTYVVRAYGKQKGKTVWAKRYKTIETATCPAKVKKIKTKSTANSVTLSWSKAEGATGYRVYRYNKSSGSWKVIVKSTAKTKYTVKSLPSGKSYTFAVKPYFKSGDDTVWAKKYTKVTASTVAIAVAKALAVESSGYNSNSEAIILDISSEGWKSDFVKANATATVIVDGKALKVPCKIPSSKNADGRYEVTIGLEEIGISSGTTVEYVIEQGTVKTKDGSQYNKTLKGTCDIG